MFSNFKDEMSNLNLMQKVVLPIDDNYDSDIQEAINYLKSVREEASYLQKNPISSCNSDSELNDNYIQESYYYDDFNKLIYYQISHQLLNIRNDPLYKEYKQKTLKYILSIKEEISNLTEVLQTDEIISVSNWKNILNSDQKPCITIGKWNSYNWCNLLEYFSNQIQENMQSFILNTHLIHWILLSLISMHALDSFNPHVSYCMQNIRRYLETNDFPLLEKSDYFRIETIIIIIKDIYNQY